MKKEMGRRCGKKRKKKIGRRGSVRMCGCGQKIKKLKSTVIVKKK